MEYFLFFLLLFEIAKTAEVDNYNMEIFDENNYMKGQFAVNSKGDVIIEYSDNDLRLFYGIKKNGKGFFNGEYIKKLQLNNNVRYESENIFISLKNSNNDDIQYLLNFGANDTAVELFNFEGNIGQSENYIIKTPNEVLGNSIFSYVNSLLEFNNNNTKEYLLIYIYEQNYILKKLSFSGFNLNNIVINEVQTSPSTSNVNENRMVNGIVFNENYILVLFISGDKYFCNIFDFELILKSNFALDIIEKFEDGFGLFAKAINLKEKYIAFFYYIKEGKLKFQLGQIENLDNIFNPSLNFNITQGIFLSDPRLNEIIKLNSQRCAFFAFKEKHKLNNNDNFGEVSDSLTILLFDLYNDYQNLKIREYEIRLETYKYHREISAAIYNGFICFSSSVYQSSHPNNIISIFMMFGYFNQTNQENNKTIDIYEYISNESNNHKNIVDDILNNIEIIIENNIFGYIFLKDRIKLVSIPSEIEFYNNEKILKNDDILNRDYLLKENINIYIKTGNYFFEYQIIVTEPEYEVFDSYPINISNYPSSDNELEQKSFFQPQKFYGKITSVNFMLYSKVDLCSYEKLLNSDCNIQKNNNSEVYKKLTNNIIQSYPEKGESVTIETGNNYVYQITTMDNEISSLNGTIDNPYNLSIINLGDCEDLLRGENNITDDQSLIFLKYEKLTEVVSDKSIQYEVYHPTTKQKLNLSICESSTISIYIPINLPEETKQIYTELDRQGYDLFNPNDSFYNDLCTPFKSKDGTDVPMNDRRNDYYLKYNNNTQCQANCQYDDYLSDLGYLKCECGVSNEDIETEHFDKFKNKVIYESFYDILKNSNYKVVKCYNLIFNKKIFLKNYGSMLVLAYFAIFTSFLIYYIIVGINPLKINTMKTINENQIKEKRKTVLLENVGIDINNNANKRQSKFKYKRIKKQSMNPPKKNSTKFINTKNEDKRNTFSNNDISIKTNSNFIRNKKINNHQKAKYKSIILFNKELNIINNNNNNNYPNNKNKKNINETVNSPSIQSLKSPMINPKKMKFSLSQKNIINDIKELNEIKEENKKLDDYELNNLEYLEAIELDKRNILDVYWSTLKREHIILFTFFIRNDYNLVSIKFSRFIFLVCTDMAMNVFFFTDDSMHKVYKNYGKYDFVQQIPQIIYSTIVSQVLEVFLCFLSLTDKHFYQMKEIKNVQNNMNLIFRILRCVKIKLIGFYAFTLILFAFYWYLVSSFCAVYQNTQIIFIKDSISSFLLGLLYPFVLYIFPAILRVLSLKDREKKRFKVIFIISDIIPIF